MTILSKGCRSIASAEGLCAVILALACDLGGAGGGPSPRPLPIRPLIERVRETTDPVARGAVVYRQYGCGLCHGIDGKGEVANENSETGGKINGLTKVKEGYAEVEVAKMIREGVKQVGKKDAAGPTPPFRMPSFANHLKARQVDDLVAYLFSLYPGAGEEKRNATTETQRNGDLREKKKAGKKEQPGAGKDDWDKE
ncbi:MAG: cytochrome c [Deltaproteobacteria bacterium]|nr:cytochrome c [Deltaproteobacteria bacterium]